MERKKKLGIVKRSLIGIGNTVISGINKIKENQRYKQSSEYKDKVIGDLQFKEEVLRRQAKIAKLMPKKQNPFNMEDAFKW